MSLKFDPKPKIICYQNEKFTVYNITQNDYYCDLLLLAQNDKQQLLIPCHKKFLTENIDFFSRMFDESSNWFEGQSKQCETDDRGIQIVNLEFDFPKYFALYLKSYYDGELELTAKNYLEMYKIADYLHDFPMVNRTEQELRTPPFFGV